MSDLQCAARVFVARHGEAVYESELLSDAGGWLTPLGREVLAAYRALEARIAEAAERELAALAGRLREHPLEAGEKKA